MIHGINNTFLYSAKRILTLMIKNNSEHYFTGNKRVIIIAIKVTVFTNIKKIVLFSKGIVIF